MYRPNLRISGTHLPLLAVFAVCIFHHVILYLLLTLCAFIGYVFGLPKYSKTEADEQCSKDTKLSVLFFIRKHR